MQVTIISLTYTIYFTFFKDILRNLLENCLKENGIIGYKNISKLKSKLRDYGAVFMKTDEVFVEYEKRLNGDK